MKEHGGFMFLFNEERLWEAEIFGRSGFSGGSGKKKVDVVVSLKVVCGGLIVVSIRFLREEMDVMRVL